jgi:hypothetical protein
MVVGALFLVYPGSRLVFGLLVQYCREVLTLHDEGVEGYGDVKQKLLDQ